MNLRLAYGRQSSERVFHSAMASSCRVPTGIPASSNPPLRDWHNLHSTHAAPIFILKRQLTSSLPQNGQGFRSLIGGLP